MTYRIDGDRLTIGGHLVPFVASPHVGGRIEPTLIVLHDTSDRLRADDSVSWFCNPKSKVSAHFVVGRDGSVTQCVPVDHAAWHAGQSEWCGRANCNSYGIGIEIDNPGKLTRRGGKAYAWFGDGWPLSELVEMTTPEHGSGWWMPYPQVQIDAVEALVRALAIRFPTITDVAGHYQVSPKRKVDPGPQFPMALMQAIVANRTAPDQDRMRAVQERLAALGYHPGNIDGIIGPRMRSAIREFQEQAGLETDGQPSDRLIGALFAADAPGPVTAPREAATMADVRASSGTMQRSAGVQRTAEVAAVGVAAEALVSPVPASAPSSAMEAVSQVNGYVTTGETARGLTGRLTGLMDWVATPAGMRSAATLAVIAVVWWLARSAEGRRFRDYVTGRHNGGRA